MSLRLGWSNGSTEVIVGEKEVELALSSSKGRQFVVTSSAVSGAPWAARLLDVMSPACIEELPDGEKAKEVDVLLSLLKRLVGCGASRGDSLVALGGGSTLDVAGLASALYMRGMHLVNVPTTLLSASDAAVGGKNGINFAGAKNVLGTIRQPSSVMIYLPALLALPDLELRHGVPEIVKHGMTLDTSILRLLSGPPSLRDPETLKKLVVRSLSAKAEVVAQDEQDVFGKRIVLNYGHTVGHALEAGSGFRLHHGPSVSVGMIAEARLEVELGLADQEVLDELMSVLGRLKLPVSVSEACSQEGMGACAGFEVGVAKRALIMDKKREGAQISMPVVDRPGSWGVKQVAIADLQGALEGAWGGD